MKIRSTPLRITLWLGVSLSSAAASQPVTQTWVSGTGKDTGSCPLTAPCATFQYAEGQTIAGGTIYAITSGSFGIVTITKSLNVIAADGVDAAIAVTGNNVGVHVNTSNTVVLLKGLHIGGQSQSGSTGIEVDQGTVTADHVTAVNMEFGIAARGGLVLVTNDLLIGNAIGVGVGQTGSAYVGESRISGNVQGFFGNINSYGDNDLNGNTTCDVCEATVTEVQHDQ